MLIREGNYTDIKLNSYCFVLKEKKTLAQTLGFDQHLKVK
jgi:hypothetical protein